MWKVSGAGRDLFPLLFFCLFVSFALRTYTLLLYSNYLTIQIFNHWWNFYSDRTRIKSLLKRLKNIGMASKKLYRNTLKCHFSRLWKDYFCILFSFIVSFHVWSKNSPLGFIGDYFFYLLFLNSEFSPYIFFHFIWYITFVKLILEC